MFVTLEGPEGAGKSTVIRMLAKHLEEGGRQVLITREPGDGPVGKQIREILLHGEDLTPQAELFLFLADRAQHVEAVIKPAIESGQVVLCDRYSDSTVVYQGYGRSIDLDVLRKLNEQATGGLKPDLTLLLDLPPEVGLARQEGKDRLDNESLAFHQRVREGFLKEAARETGRWRIIDATRPVEEVARECWSALEG